MIRRKQRTLGAFPSLAIPYRVRVAMYWSELAAEMVKMRIQLIVSLSEMSLTNGGRDVRVDDGG